MLRKFVAFLFVGVIAVSLVGCAGSEDTAATDDTTATADDTGAEGEGESDESEEG